MRKMKKRLLVTLFITLLFAGILSVGLNVSRVAAADAILKITPPDTILNWPNSFFDVYVEIADVTDLYGFDIKITWDNTVITFDSLDTVPLATIWPQGYFEPLNPTPPPVYQTGPGWFRYAAVATGGSGYTGSDQLFGLRFNVAKSCNFEWKTDVHFDTVTLSNSAWTNIPRTLEDGHYTMTAREADIHFVVVDDTPSKPFEYCKTFKVEVHVSDICAHLKDYDLTINYDSELLDCRTVDWTGTVLETGISDNTTAGHVHVSYPGLTPTRYVGEDGLLFTLTFHVQFNDDANHIWRTTGINQLDAHIWLANAGGLSFDEGTLTIDKIDTTDTSETITVDLIQGDVDCDGKVGTSDLRCVAAYYDKKLGDPEWPEASKYDVKQDATNTIDIFDLVVVATNFGHPHT